MLYEKYTKGNEVLEIHYDECNESPREWDNLGTMACFHSRYSLGDDHKYDMEYITRLENNPKYISLPLYIYDHGGVTMNTTGYSCPWDSGKVGIIFVSKEQVRKEYGWKRITKAREKTIEGYLAGEVSTYDEYLIGNVYGFISYKDGEEVDSCWGFYGDEHEKSGLLENAGVNSMEGWEKMI